MSVIKAKRQEGQLVVLTKAREMCAYTVAICKNEKNFPKRDRWIITQPIVTEALSIMSCIRRANSVRVETQDDYTYRRNQQVQALAHAEAMLTLMDVQRACWMQRTKASSTVKPLSLASLTGA